MVKPGVLLVLQLSGTVGQCTKDCIDYPDWASDDFCDDGGPGAAYNGCQYGTSF